jgi:ribonuclease P protein component
LLAVRSVPNELAWSRFAYAIPKRVGNAVARNRLRRRLRAIIRLTGPEEGFDVVISARNDSASATYQQLDTELKTLLRRARLLASPE